MESRRIGALLIQDPTWISGQYDRLLILPWKRKKTCGRCLHTTEHIPSRTLYLHIDHKISLVVVLEVIKKYREMVIQNRWRVLLSIVVLVILIGTGYAWLVNGRWPEWTGFGEYIGPVVLPNQTFQPSKTLWDLMQLLIIPAILAGGAYWLNESARQQEIKIAEKRAEDEDKIASDNRQEIALQTYLDKMTELLLDKKLRETEVESEVRAVARARTLTVLRRLDKDRKGALLRFLYEAKLIENNYLFRWDWILGQDEKRLKEFIKQKFSIDWVKEAKIEKIDNGKTIMVSIKEKYLSLSLNNERNKINLNIDDGRTNEFIAKTENGKLNIYQNNRVIDLSEADLSEANLRGSSLSFADLSKANLSEANLRGSSLSFADLSKANLSEANLSSRADLSGANLNEANLSGANLNEANLSEAILSGANLRGANLRGADLSWAILNLWVDLRGADLRGADLKYLGDRGGIYLKGALYNQDTQWHIDIDPSAEGAICVNE